jgi:hypothetical protein
MSNRYEPWRKGPDGSPRIEGVVDDDGVYHFILGVFRNGEFISDRDGAGWLYCLCNKLHPGPEVLFKTVTCLECLVAYNG